VWGREVHRIEVIAVVDAGDGGLQMPEVSVKSAQVR
jgi:hypothetical protein